MFNFDTKSHNRLEIVRYQCINEISEKQLYALEKAIEWFNVSEDSKILTIEVARNEFLNAIKKAGYVVEETGA